MDVSQYLEIFIDETSADTSRHLSDCIMTLEKEPDNKDTINESIPCGTFFKRNGGNHGI